MDFAKKYEWGFGDSRSVTQNLFYFTRLRCSVSTCLPLAVTEWTLSSALSVKLFLSYILLEKSLIYASLTFKFLQKVRINM